MAKLLIKITNQPGDQFPHRTVGGCSGKDYLFLFDPAHQAYVYAPADDFEIDDIFGLVAIPGHPFRYGPIIVGNASEPDKAAPLIVAPSVTPDKYADLPIEGLHMLAAEIGLTLREAHDVHMVRAQINAYFVGRAVGEKIASGAIKVKVTTEESPAPAPRQSEPAGDESAPHVEEV